MSQRVRSVWETPGSGGAGRNGQVPHPQGQAVGRDPAGTGRFPWHSAPLIFVVASVCGLTGAYRTRKRWRVTTPPTRSPFSANSLARFTRSQSGSHSSSRGESDTGLKGISYSGAARLPMPRARMFRPEHRSHRKVGQLSHFEYRIWVGMVLEADDEGRCTTDAQQLKASIVPFASRITLASVMHAVAKLAQVGLISLYEVGGNTYAFFPSWHDWQHPKYPTPSRIPPPVLGERSPEGVVGDKNKKKIGLGEVTPEPFSLLSFSSSKGPEDPEARRAYLREQAARLVRDDAARKGAP